MRRIRSIRSLFTLAFWLGLYIFSATAQENPPNIVVIFCDDLGYGDLGCFGHPTIKTPHLDRMAAEGQKWTNFYAAASVCTPSRAGLMTGRLPIRSGMCSDKRRVLFPDSTGGLPKSEITVATALQQKGYATACIGKWHLGHLPEFLPTSHGFDSYFGIPYSNDMDRNGAKSPKGRAAFLDPKSEYWNVPLMRDKEVIERPAHQPTLIKRYTEEAVKTISRNRDNAFFLYLAHSLPHVPLFRSPAFEGHSSAGLYGDVIEEIDWSVGEVLRELRRTELDRKTLVVFTSDNGPWLVFDTHGGSAGPLRGGKGATWEGGMREPTLFWWPGKITPGVVHEMGSTLDFFPTFTALAGASMPDRTYDGYDLAGPLFRGSVSPRKEMFYYWGEQLWAVRSGAHKLHYTTKTEYVGEEPIKHDPPLLFHLNHDPGEKFDIAKDNADTVAQLKQLATEHQSGVKRVESHLVGRQAKR